MFTPGMRVKLLADWQPYYGSSESFTAGTEGKIVVSSEVICFVAVPLDKRRQTTIMVATKLLEPL